MHWALRRLLELIIIILLFFLLSPSNILSCTWLLSHIARKACEKFHNSFLHLSWYIFDVGMFTFDKMKPKKKKNRVMLQTHFIWCFGLLMLVMELCVYGTFLFNDKTVYSCANTCVEIFKKDELSHTNFFPPAFLKSDRALRQQQCLAINCHCRNRVI